VSVAGSRYRSIAAAAARRAGRVNVGPMVRRSDVCVVVRPHRGVHCSVPGRVVSKTRTLHARFHVLVPVPPASSIIGDAGEVDEGIQV